MSIETNYTIIELILLIISIAFSTHIYIKYKKSLEHEKQLKEDLQAISHALNEINTKIDDSCHELSTSTEEIMAKSLNASDIIGDSLQETQKTEATLLSLYESNSEIKKLLEVIEDIGIQSKVLSLNANIEAEKAGAAGEGFAVVASEINSLAQQSKSSLDAIEDALQDIQTKIGNAVGSISKTARSMKNADQVSEQITSAIKGQNQINLFISNHLTEFERSLSLLDNNKV